MLRLVEPISLGPVFVFATARAAFALPYLVSEPTDRLGIILKLHVKTSLTRNKVIKGELHRFVPWFATRKCVVGNS